MERTTEQYREFLQKHLGDGGFLQSKEWLAFQESFGRKRVSCGVEDIAGDAVEHTLSFVGKYWYIPRGPIASADISEDSLKKWYSSLAAAARENHVRWIRIEPSAQEILNLLKNDNEILLRKSPHDVQPKEIFVIPIIGDENALLSRMKSKTRYNIRLAEKKGVQVFSSRDRKYIDAFCDLVEVTAKRDGITPHPRAYYQKMFEMIPEDMLKLYVAEYQGEILAANSVLFFGKYATYLHGASSNNFRSLMSPYLLQWRQIEAAREAGCEYYDFGGVKTEEDEQNKSDWAGITRFKTGFFPEQKSTSFLGSYDLVIDKNRYVLYNKIQHIRRCLKYVEYVREFFHHSR